MSVNFPFLLLPLLGRYDHSRASRTDTSTQLNEEHPHSRCKFRVKAAVEQWRISPGLEREEPQTRRQWRPPGKRTVSAVTTGLWWSSSAVNEIKWELPEDNEWRKGSLMNGGGGRGGAAISQHKQSLLPGYVPGQGIKRGQVSRGLSESAKWTGHRPG